jgi:hypothetical protein
MEEPVTRDNLRRVVAVSGASLTIVVLAILVSAASSSSPVAFGERVARPPIATGRPDTLLWTQMQNVDLHIDATHAMHLRTLRGQVITLKGDVPVLDDPTSFKIRITAATVALDGPALTALMNEIVFNYKGSPVRRLRITIENGEVVQHGVMHKGVDIPFTMNARPELQPDGTVKLRPTKMRVFSGVDGFKLLHALGIHLDKMLNHLDGAHGAFVRGDDIYLRPTEIIPPPKIEGRLTSLRIEGNMMVQEFERTADDTVFGTFVKPPPGPRNFIYFRGAHLTFGKLTMTDTDLFIQDADERDPFDVLLTEYNKQLVAGYTRNKPNYGLHTLMVDYAKLGKVQLTQPVGYGPAPDSAGASQKRVASSGSR